MQIFWSEKQYEKPVSLAFLTDLKYVTLESIRVSSLTICWYIHGKSVTSSTITFNYSSCNSFVTLVCMMLSTFYLLSMYRFTLIGDAVNNFSAFSPLFYLLVFHFKINYKMFMGIFRSTLQKTHGAAPQKTRQILKILKS